jgi:hypothetical protein
MSCCLDSHITTRNPPVDGEMDRLRILTTGNDYGPGLSQLPDLTHCGIKQESSSPPHYTLIKQEIAPANFVLKSELPDPQYDNSTYQKQSFKNCVALPNVIPVNFPPTPTEDTSEKLLVGSTSKFLPDSNNSNNFECVIYVKGDTSMLDRVEFFIGEPKIVINSAPFEISQNFSNDKNVKILLYYKNTKRPTVVDIPVRVDSTKSGIVCPGPERQVDYPQDVAETQRKISELASWLQAPSGGNSNLQPPSRSSPPLDRKLVFSDFTSRRSANQAAVNGDVIHQNGTIWPKSAPTSPLSPGSPSDTRIIRSASSSPIRHQTVLPNPCCRQKPFNRSNSINQEPILSNQNSIDGEPIAKRRPAPLASMGTLGIQNGTTRFTPISSVPDSNYSSIPFERIATNDPISINHQEVQIGMLPEQITGMRLPSEGGQPQSILITSSNGTTPAKVQHTIVVRENPNIKQEYFVQDTNTDITITTNNSNMLNNNSDHIRNQRTGRKCRKVYGVNNRHEWCTACRWKKACRRFPS